MGLPTNFVALKDITIEGVPYSRGDAIDPDALPYVTLARLEKRGKITRADSESPFSGNGPKHQVWVQHATSGLVVNTPGFMNVVPVLSNASWSADYAAAMREEVEDAWGGWVDIVDGYEYRFTEPGIYSVTLTLSVDGASGNFDKDSSISVFMAHHLPVNVPDRPHVHAAFPAADYMDRIGIDTKPFKITQSRLDLIDPEYPEDTMYTGFQPVYRYIRHTGTVTLTDVTLTSVITKWDAAQAVDTWAFGNGRH